MKNVSMPSRADISFLQPLFRIMSAIRTQEVSMPSRADISFLPLDKRYFLVSNLICVNALSG